MRASWKGYYRIGDVVLPVRLYAATRSAGPNFVQLHAADRAPVRRIAVCSKDGKELSDDDIMRAAEYNGTFIELSEKELERHTGLERDIVVRQITDPGDIKAMYCDNPYYLVPDRGGEFAYAILRRAFEKTNKAAIATLLFYGRERLSVISSGDGVMLLQMLRFHEEIVPKSDIELPALPQPAPAHVAAATQLLERYSLPFYASDYRDQQTDILNEIVERKAKGLPLKKPRAIAHDTTPSDEVLGRIKQMLAGDPRMLQS